MPRSGTRGVLAEFGRGFHVPFGGCNATKRHAAGSRSIQPLQLNMYGHFCKRVALFCFSISAIFLPYTRNRNTQQRIVILEEAHLFPAQIILHTF
jgi:hypothetical protein